MSRPALSDVSFSIHPGERVAIIGPNGSGKTTVGMHLNGLLLPSDGTVTVNDLDTRIPANIAQIRRLVGTVFADPESQVVADSVEDDIAFGPENYSMGAAEIRARVEASLDTFGLQPLRHANPTKLSEGQKHMQAGAGVAALDPEYFLFDEALEALDGRARSTMLAVVAELHRRGKGIILITNRLSDAVTCPRILVLREGCLAADTDSHSLLSDVAALHELGINVPPIVAFRAALAARGLPTLPATTDPHELATALLEAEAVPRLV